MHGASVKKEV